MIFLFIFYPAINDRMFLKSGLPLSRKIGKAQNTLSEILSINRLPQEVRDDCRGNRTISRSGL